MRQAQAGGADHDQVLHHQQVCCIGARCPALLELSSITDVEMATRTEPENGRAAPGPWRRDQAHRRRLAEQHDEWTEGRRYLGLDVLSRARLTLITDDDTTSAEVTDPRIQALT